MKSKNVKSVSYAKGPKPPLCEGFAPAWERPSVGQLLPPGWVGSLGVRSSSRESLSGALRWTWSCTGGQQLLSTHGTVRASHSVKAPVSFQ